jgi:hypothetical protein
MLDGTDLGGVPEAMWYRSIEKESLLCKEFRPAAKSGNSMRQLELMGLGGGRGAWSRLKLVDQLARFDESQLLSGYPFDPGGIGLEQADFLGESGVCGGEVLDLPLHYRPVPVHLIEADQTPIPQDRYRHQSDEEDDHQPQVPAERRSIPGRRKPHPTRRLIDT